MVVGPNIQPHGATVFHRVEHGARHRGSQALSAAIAHRVDVANCHSALFGGKQVRARGRDERVAFVDAEEHTICHHRRVEEVGRLSGRLAVRIQLQ